MKIYQWNNLDAIYWSDVEQYRKVYPDKKQVYVWHGDSMSLWTFNAIDSEPSISMRIGAYLGNGNFVFYDNDKNSHYIFKGSTCWSIWREMNDYLKEHENEYARR